MAMKKRNKMLAIALSALFASEAGLSSFVPLTVAAKEKEETAQETVVNASASTTTDKFTWDNATVYFVLTDRFLNADKSNDHSYGRGLQADGKTPIEGLDTYTNPGTFHGGDLKGLTQKVEEGYFDDLGVNAIWITAPYEQVHGYTSGNVKSNNATEYPDPDKQGFPYYGYHGYWALDYTNIDANWGNEEDLANFVENCHEHGIRVILDVVMNHLGYTTMKDAVDYGFDGALKGDWESYYYGNSTYLMGGDPESENYWDQDTSVWQEKWWGKNFVRATFQGYTGSKNGGDDYTKILYGLPDIITEAGAAEAETPPLMVTKWKEEGRLEQEQKELDDFFSETGYKKQPRYYIIKWLTDYVREYGVDGFRCDTAKHVDKDAWNDLKVEADKALKEWRKNNPSKAGADWDESFWMTGEEWGHGMGKSSYFTNGFDSMINFTFPKNSEPTNMEGTYKDYADTINSDENFNVLSYINSHDDNDSAKVTWDISSAQMMANGTNLLLAPGGVQIYYGNEMNRGLEWKDFFTGNDYLDQRFRSDMDWENYDKVCLAHWQKLGQFRNNHPAVGAGQHEKLDGDVYTFSRTYHLEEEDEDKVVCALPQAAGTHTISVGDVFDDGEVLTDAYSGKTYTVSGGSVEATTSDATSPILLQGSGIVKPSVNAKAKNGNGYKTDTLSVTLKANRVTDTYYSINGGTKKPYVANDVITIGGDTGYEEETTLVVEGKSEEDGTPLTKTFTYKRSQEPVVSDGLRIEASKDEFSQAPNAYVYVTDAAGTETSLTGAWPGVAMTEESDAWVYEAEEPEIEGTIRFILSQGDWRSAAPMQPGIVFEGGARYSKATGEITSVPVGEPGRVNIKYVTSNGSVLKEIYRVGAVGKKYTTYPAEFEGRTLLETPANASGVFEKESTVTYIYSGEGEEPTPTVAPTPTVTVEPTVSGTPTQAVTPTVTEAPTVTPGIGEFSLDALTAVKTQEGIRLIANAQGGQGTIRYMFSYERDGKEVLIQNFQTASEIIWKPSKTGTFKLHVYAINNGKIMNKTVESYTVR